MLRVPDCAIERNDLLGALGRWPSTESVAAIHVDNRQNPLAEDPDYDVWVYVTLHDGAVYEFESKNTWKIVPDIEWHAAQGWDEC